MNLVVKLDFSTDYVKRHGLGALLTATLMHKQYLDAQRCGVVGPEGYAEWWMEKNLHPRLPKFENLTLNCFLQMLRSCPRG